MTSLTPHDILASVRAHAEKDTAAANAHRTAAESLAWDKTELALHTQYGIPVGAAQRTFGREARVWSGLLETDVLLCGVTLRTAARQDRAKYATTENIFGDYIALERIDRKGRATEVSVQELASLLAENAA